MFLVRILPLLLATIAVILIVLLQIENSFDTLVLQVLLGYVTIKEISVYVKNKNNQWLKD